MLSQSLKDILFGAARLASKPSAWLKRRELERLRDPEGLYIHLGCGPHYIPGMINCDGNLLRRIDLWLDLRNRLPFADESACVVYCSHTLEHLLPEDALHVLREIGRVLRADGVARIAVPDLDHALRIARGDASCQWPRAFSDAGAQAINYLFCDGQHKYAYNASLLGEFARQAGFEHTFCVSEHYGVAPRRYGKLELGNEPEGSLVVELRRTAPASPLHPPANGA